MSVYQIVFEVLGVLFLASVWMVAILRLLRRRRWSPLRPAVMAIVVGGCLALMADTLLDWVQTGELRMTFYLAAWNLGMALFDLMITVALDRQGRIATTAKIAMRIAVPDGQRAS
ncbi:MAG: hypothetical protein AAF675_15595 [Pseudomonadota bacterium]